MVYFMFFCKAIHMCSSDSMLMSAYLPICIASQNEIETIIDENGGEFAFDKLFSTGFFQKIKNIMNIRFNFDGKPTAGQKVELFDEYQLWCFVLDSYCK